MEPILRIRHGETKDHDDMYYYECAKCHRTLGKKKSSKPFHKMKKENYCAHCGTHADWRKYE